MPDATGLGESQEGGFKKWAGRWRGLTIFQKFEDLVVLILTGLIAVVIASTIWNLAIKVVVGLVLAQSFDPTDPAVFQSVFGMIFTVIIALEFERTLYVVSARKDSVVQVRAVILIGMLAIVRKLIILDLTATDAPQLFALAAATLSLGGVYWLVNDREKSSGG